MNVKGKVLLQLLNKSKLKNETKTFLEQNFSLFLVKFKKLWFSASLNQLNTKTFFLLIFTKPATTALIISTTTKNIEIFWKGH